ncbi:hypothetical protein Tco_1212256 [Tanacetum coccineum]
MTSPLHHHHFTPLQQPLSPLLNTTDKLHTKFEVCLKFKSKFECVCVCSAYIGLEWSGDQVKLERWQGMVRARATRSEKDGLLGVQGEEVAFFLVPKVMTRLGMTRR